MAVHPLAVSTRLFQIEDEMKRIGLWQTEPLKPAQLDFQQPFAADTMAFSQWLQFVFMPRVNELIDADGPFPSNSHVADKAFREWRMYGDEKDVEDLIDLLREFDTLFE